MLAVIPGTAASTANIVDITPVTVYCFIKV